MSSNLLLSNTKGLKLEDIKNWILSATRYQGDYDIALLVCDQDPDILDFCAYKNVKVYDFSTDPNLDKKGYYYYRCNLLSKLLKKLPQYDYVLMTDVKDVVFQEDPFPKLIAKVGDKDAVLSSENINISSEPWNQNVLYQLFGGEVCDEIRENEVVNSGIMFGRPQFLSQINRLMYDVVHTLSGEQIRDQAALQYLYFSFPLIKERCVLSDGNDKIATHLAVAGPTKFYNDWNFKNNLKCGHAVFDTENLQVKNPDGDLYSIVHQYNRVPEWFEPINNFYSLDLHKIYKKAVSTDNVAAVVCSTQNFNAMYSVYEWDKAIKTYPSLNLLFDCTAKVDLDNSIKFAFYQENICYYDLQRLQTQFNRFDPPILQHRWSDGGSRNINWFFPHLRMLYWYLANPNYDYYWFMDDDCSFIDGDMNELLRTTSFLDADCIITYIFTEGENKQEGTHYADNEQCSFHGDHSAWFHWFPGPGDILPGGAKKYGSYFPFVRLSKGALMKLWDLHNQGFIGYSEGYVPSILNHFGYKLHSLNNKDATLNVPCDTNMKIAHKRGEILWKNL